MLLSENTDTVSSEDDDDDDEDLSLWLGRK